MAALEEQFIVHRDLADLGAQPLDLVVALVRRPALQGRLAPSEKLLSPVGQRRRRDPELSREAVQRLAAEQAQERLRLPPRRETAGLAPAVSVSRRGRARE